MRRGLAPEADGASSREEDGQPQINRLLAPEVDGASLPQTRRELAPEADGASSR